jgi:peptidoglycan/xylan/chitin deacetylase (PgdA/CDA1 family)
VSARRVAALALAGSILTLTACSPAPAGTPTVTPAPLPPGTTETAAPSRPAPVSVHKVAAIPVLAWHQVIGGVATNTAEDVIWDFNKDCKPTAPVCNAPNNPETVSLTQLDQELTWLASQGYSSITAAQYQAWDAGQPVALPRKPILLTTDDSTINEAAGVTALLQKHGFNMVMFVVTQFADGATAGKQPYAGWNFTWAQLKELPAAQWSYAFHAGAAGHNVAFPNNPGSTYYYPTQLPTETAAQYEQRVSGEISQGRAELTAKLGDRVNTSMWAVPWNDLAQPGKPTSGTDPARWLAPWAATQFPIVFLQDPKRNGVERERFRLEVQGTWSLATFRRDFLNDLGYGFFDLDT